MNNAPISICHLSIRSHKANLDVKIYFTSIGYMALESWANFAWNIFLISREKCKFFFKFHSIFIFDKMKMKIALIVL